MCNSHFSNEVCNGAISITQWGFNNDHYKINPVGQWGKSLAMTMGFVDHLGHSTKMCTEMYLPKLFAQAEKLVISMKKGFIGIHSPCCERSKLNVIKTGCATFGMCSF